MNDIERRVAQGLRAYGEELVMTTQDVDRLEQGLGKRQERSRKDLRSRIWQGAVAACAVTGVVLGTLALRNDPVDRPQPTAPPPVTMAALQGIWRVDGSDWLWRFTSDGRLVTSNKPDLLTGAVPADALAVRTAPGGLIMTDPATPRCEQLWSASLSADGHLHAVQPPETAACPGEDGVAGPGVDWGLVRVSPASKASLAITSNSGSTSPREVVFENQDYLAGTWLLRGTGTVLTVVKNEAPQDPTLFRFAVQDLGASSEPRTGTMRARLNGQVLFWPPEGTTPRCIVEYESVVTRGSSLEAKLDPGSCDRFGGLTDTWIRLN